MDARLEALRQNKPMAALDIVEGGLELLIADFRSISDACALISLRIRKSLDDGLRLEKAIQRRDGQEPARG